jgi:hypothetical protein
MVLNPLDFWPVPIVVQYGGSPALYPPAPEDEDNIMAALMQSDRVSSINLTITSSLLEKLSAIEKPFSELEDLVLLSRDSLQLTLPSTFRWGPRLRRLHLTSIACSTLPHLLHSSGSLVDLQLHEGLYPWHFSPETLTDALSGMAQLRSISLHFLSTTIRLAPPPPSGELVVLPVLAGLTFRGNTEYLEGLVARIDAPCLRDIEVTFFDEFIFDLSKLSEFIDRIEMHKSHLRAHILLSERAVCLSLIQPGAPTCLKLQVFCERLSEQLFPMARICIGFSAVLLNVEDLRISATRRSIWGDVMGYQWLMLIELFTGVKWLHIAENISTNIVRTFQLPDRRLNLNTVTPVLPALHKLYIPQPETRHAPLPEAVVSFITSRRLFGHHIGVEYERLGHWHINELRGSGRMYARASATTR